MAYFSELYTGTRSLFVGLRITIKEFFNTKVTLQYPHEHLKMTPRYRGHIELVKNEETGLSKCIVCGMCQRGCPSGCISLAGEKREGVKGKVLTQYTLDFTKCSLCGICIESCRPGAIQFSKEYNLASTNRNDFVFDLIKRLEEQN
jgi:NADH-quinone oxidoreductase subunit I